MSRTVAIATLGCKTNQFESAAIEERLREAGYLVVPFEAGASLVVVNSCTVTAATDAQSRNLVRRARRLNPCCRVVVTGCYAQVDPSALLAIPGVSLVLGNEEKRDFLKLLEEAPEQPAAIVSEIREVEAAAAPAIASFAEHRRAFVQIQNGCDAFCAYCIIPYARGRSRSVPADEVIAQVRRLEAAGYPEIVLTGIHIGGYGLDFTPPSSLLALVRRLLAETGIGRLRLGSLEPTEISPELIAQVADTPRLLPHFHIPLQAGDDAVLARMNRRYDTAFFRQVVEAIHAALPEAAIGLDVIAGFPGESEAEFGNACRFIESLPVSHLHVFPFSRRPGTPAATMPGQLPGDLIRERAARLRQIGEAKNAAFARCFVGRTLEVVVEGGGKGGRRKGLSGNYLSVHFDGSSELEGQVIEVAVEEWAPDGLHGSRR